MESIYISLFNSIVTADNNKVQLTKDYSDLESLEKAISLFFSVNNLVHCYSGGYISWLFGLTRSYKDIDIFIDLSYNKFDTEWFNLSLFKSYIETCFSHHLTPSDEKIPKKIYDIIFDHIRYYNNGKRSYNKKRNISIIQNEYYIVFNDKFSEYITYNILIIFKVKNVLLKYQVNIICIIKYPKLINIIKIDFKSLESKRMFFFSYLMNSFDLAICKNIIFFNNNAKDNLSIGIINDYCFYDKSFHLLFKNDGFIDDVLKSICITKISRTILYNYNCVYLFVHKNCTPNQKALFDRYIKYRKRISIKTTIFERTRPLRLSLSCINIIYNVILYKEFFILNV